jgi:hypothetical protein
MIEIPDDAIRAFLFCNPEAKLFAISILADGANLPLKSGHWLFEKEIDLGVHEAIAH